MKKIFIVYGHYNDKSFNASIRDTFVETVNNNGHSTDVVDLYKEKFDPVFSGEEPNVDVLNHRKRIENSDVIVLIAPIWNFRIRRKYFGLRSLSVQESSRLCASRTLSILVAERRDNSCVPVLRLTLRHKLYHQQIQ